MITGVVLARNEELNIVACLAAFRPHVSELFLIDMESSDRTVELAQPYVDRVLTHPLVANFDAARNIAIPEATYDWLWFVDADEQVPAETGRQINELLRAHQDEFEAITIPFKTFFCDHWMQHNGWWPGYTCCRVLKRGYFEFSRLLHGGVQLSGRQIRFPASPDTAIAHYSFRSLEHYVSKFNRYTTIEGQQLHEHGHKYDWRGAIRGMMQDLWMSYEFHNGQRDGTWGWVVTWLAALYRWMSYTKMLDEIRARNEPVPESAPNSLAEFFEAMENELASFRRLKPKLPLGLIVHAEADELPSGYPNVAARLLALARLRRTLQWRHGRAKSHLSPDAKVDPVIWTLDQVRRPGHGISIFVRSGPVPRPDSYSVYSVYWPIFEMVSAGLTVEDGAALQQFDAIWVSSPDQLRWMRQMGVAEERLTIIPSWIDPRIFTPLGDSMHLTRTRATGFRILAILKNEDDQVYRGLLTAICQLASFSDDLVTLLVGSTSQSVGEAAFHSWTERWSNDNPTKPERVDIHEIQLPTDAEEQARLIRAVDGLLLEGDQNVRQWPMRALACGRPVAVIDAAQGAENDYEGAWISVATKVGFAGHETCRDDETSPAGRFSGPLTMAVEQLFAKTRSGPLLDVARRVQADSGEAPALEELEQAITRLEDALKPVQLPPVQPDQLRVALEGEVFAAHSFSNINEILAEGFLAEPSLAPCIERRFVQPTFDDRHPRRRRLEPLLNREFSEGPEITIRHAFPPNWAPPKRGLWVHIQPWEYGYLPREWLSPLCEHVAEVWAPSQYVRRVYVDSGVPDDKIKVIPWGCDPLIFRPDAPPLLLPTEKTFRFLFVGGTILRKGFDRLFEAYLTEFGREEDVCLVIKDMGTGSFYRDGSGQQIQEAMKDAAVPEIVYFADDFLPSQMASLYTACQCLVAPYRGEGFGLPVLEAMACGLPPIVPEGGATDDFVTPDTGYRIPSREITMTGLPNLCQTGLEFDVSLSDLRSLMRQAFEHREEVRARGEVASQTVRENWTWDAAIRCMTERLWALAEMHLGKSWKAARKSICAHTSEARPVKAQVSRSSEYDETGNPVNRLEEMRAMPAATSSVTAQPDSLAASFTSPDVRSNPRSVLVQMATGPHKQLLDVSEEHHRNYATRHGMDYWRIDENPAAPKRPGWGKISLLLRALREGYDRAVWIDADAVITRPEVNLAAICENGIALVQHPNVEAHDGRRYRTAHWNTGVIVASRSPLVERFLSKIDSRSENDSAWMEQVAFNEVASQPEFRALLQPLPPAFNATPGAVVVPQPVVWAAHGWPLEQRLSFIKTWLRDVAGSYSGNETPDAHRFRVRYREEFAEHLNNLGLTESAVEVGVLRGEFSRIFLDSWKGKQLHLVDPWRNLEGYVDVSNLSEEEHKQALDEVNQNLTGHVGRFEICRRLSVEAAPRFADASLDFVFIDANHDYAEVINDMWTWYPKLRQGAVLAGHDCVDGLFPEGEFGVKFAVHEFEQQTGLKASFTEEGRWTSWYFYRI